MIVSNSDLDKEEYQAADKTRHCYIRVLSDGTIIEVNVDHFNRVKIYQPVERFDSEWIKG